jgi:branched-chain amino acid transport system ATP-binding protein
LTSNDFILETKQLTREFKGFIAVDGVNLQIKRGSIHALIGPNGAGKTTVFNLLTKFLPVSSGQIFYNGQDITALKAAEVARMGMVRSFQISAVFPHLSVLEQAMHLLEQVDLASFAQTQTVELPYGRKRALEIATTLALDPELMLLDEPTQGMGHEDVSRVVDLIRKVAANRTVLMVEHNMNVISDLSDTITVLARGSVLAEGPYAQVSKDPRVLEAYVGTAEEAA